MQNLPIEFVCEYIQPKGAGLYCYCLYQVSAQKLVRWHFTILPPQHGTIYTISGN